MEKNVKNVDYERVVFSVEFDQLKKCVTCEKRYYNEGYAELVHMESVLYSLRTMPLSVALQMAAAYVQQVGLVDYE